MAVGLSNYGGPRGKSEKLKYGFGASSGCPSLNTVMLFSSLNRSMSSWAYCDLLDYDIVFQYINKVLVELLELSLTGSIYA